MDCRTASVILRVHVPVYLGAERLREILTGLAGLKPASEHEGSHSEEELRILLSESLKTEKSIRLNIHL